MSTMENESHWDLCPPQVRSDADEDVWRYAAYRLSKKAWSNVPLAQCRTLPASINVALRVHQILRALDVLETAPGELRAVCTKSAFHQSRLYGAAMLCALRLVRQVYAPAFKGEELWKAAHALRGQLRAEMATLVSDGYIDDSVLPRRRGDSSPSVGHELAELGQVGHETLLPIRDNSPVVFRTLIEARFLSEQLLTTIGECDAPLVVREMSNGYRQIASLLVTRWGPLREEIAALCETAEMVERLAPEFLWA